MMLQTPKVVQVPHSLKGLQPFQEGGDTGVRLERRQGGLAPLRAREDTHSGLWPGSYCRSRRGCRGRGHTPRLHCDPLRGMSQHFRSRPHAGPTDTQMATPLYA